MKLSLVFLALISAIVGQSFAVIMKPKQPVLGEYIVELNRDADVTSFIRSKSFKNAKTGEVVTLEQNIRFVYTHALNGFSVRRLSEEQALELESMPEVERVTANGKTRLADYVWREDAPWPLARLSTAWKLGSSPYDYLADDSGGFGVNCYVIDTGVKDDHDEFTGRVIPLGLDSMTPGDSDGHGTGVASQMAGATFGAAPQCTILDIKVCEDSEDLYYDHAIEGLELACNDSKEYFKFVSSVVLLALQPYGAYGPLDAAISNAYLVFCLVVVVPAGDQGSENSCAYSPGRAAYSLSVAASDINDNWWNVDENSGSNWGNCVNMVAPGVDNPIACISSTTCTTTGTGTSYSAALVAGLAAYFIGLWDICLCDDVWYELWYWGIFGRISIPWYPLDKTQLAVNEMETQYGSRNRTALHAMIGDKFIFSRKKNLTSTMNKVEYKKEVRAFIGRHPELLKKMRKEF